MWGNEIDITATPYGVLINICRLTWRHIRWGCFRSLRDMSRVCRRPQDMLLVGIITRARADTKRGKGKWLVVRDFCTVDVSDYPHLWWEDFHLWSCFIYSHFIFCFIYVLFLTLLFIKRITNPPFVYRDKKSLNYFLIKKIFLFLWFSLYYDMCFYNLV